MACSGHSARGRAGTRGITPRTVAAESARGTGSCRSGDCGNFGGDAVDFAWNRFDRRYLVSVADASDEFLPSGHVGFYGSDATIFCRSAAPSAYSTGNRVVWIPRG